MPRKRRQIFISVVFVALLAFFLTVFRVARVQGDSMLPTFKSGQMVLVSRLTGPLKRGDVVLVHHGDDILIKRVARLPGETLTAHEAEDFDMSVQEDFFEKTGDLDRPLRVQQGQIVVLGDNPAVSDDSRMFGPVFLGDILGRVVNAPPKR